MTDELWAVVEPLLPLHPAQPKGGTPWVDDRAALTGIVFVLLTGIPWEYLPAEMNCGSGMTCWRRLRDWQEAGVWAELHAVLLDRLEAAQKIDWSRASCDLATVPAPLTKKGAVKPPPLVRIHPTDRGKQGTKRHTVVDTQGTPLSLVLSGANMPDVRSGRRGGPRFRPKKLHADKAYDYKPYRAVLSKRGIQARIARKGVESSQRLGKHRWVVERTQSWMNRSRRLKVRYKKRADIHLAFSLLACSLVCIKQIHRLC